MLLRAPYSLQRCQGTPNEVWLKSLKNKNKKTADEGDETYDVLGSSTKVAAWAIFCTFTVQEQYSMCIFKRQPTRAYIYAGIARGSVHIQPNTLMIIVLTTFHVKVGLVDYYTCI